MKPRIFKAGRYWYCYVNLNTCIGREETPKEAYFDWAQSVAYARS